MKTKIALNIIMLIAVSTIVSCDKESGYENFQRMRFVYQDYYAKIDADAEKFLPSGDRYSILSYSDSALNFEFDIDFNIQSVHDKEIVLPDWLPWKKFSLNEQPALGLEWDDNVEVQNFASSIRPVVSEKQEYPIYKRNDGGNYYISPRKRLCLDAGLPRNFGSYQTSDFDGYSLVRLKPGRDYGGHKGVIIQFPGYGGALKSSGVGIMAFRKSQIDSIASLQSGTPLQPFYLFQDESQSFEIVDNGKGYYSMVFYGNIDHQNKPAGWLQIGTEKFQLPRLNGNNSPAEGEVYECLFDDNGWVGFYGFNIKTHRIYR